MESYKDIEKLSHIPKANYDTEEPTKSFFERLRLLNKQDVQIHATLLGSLLSYHYLEDRDVPDEIFEAYEMSFTQSTTSLYEHYKEMLERGETSVLGFINNMKGKAFEVYLEDKLPEVYPGYTFKVAENPIQPVWDIKGINEKGEEIEVQAKMWNESKASDLQELMENNPNVLYATNLEIREKVLKLNPELADQFIPIDIKNYEFTEGVKDTLEALVDNFGINIPDSVFALVPYSTEIILGVKTIFEIAAVKRDFSKVKLDKKSRIATLKVLVLFSRFGVTAILTFAASAGGGLIFPGIGNAVGGVAGALAATIINKQINPYVLEIAYKLVGIHSEDMFYYKNAERIDNLGKSYIENRKIISLE